MAITSFIPTVWAETLNRSLNQEYIGVAHCNRDFEGEIKACGSTVKICGVNNVSVFDYSQGMELQPPESISNSVVDLQINRAKYFNFMVDDIDRVQKSPLLMSGAMQAAANALACEADHYIFSLFNKAGSHFELVRVDLENILNPLYTARTRLWEAGVSDFNQVVFEVSPAIANLLLKSKMLISHDNTALLETGSIGTLLGIPVFVSNNIYVSLESDAERHMCLLRTRRAIAFAEQISQIEAYRPDQRFADAVKGLHLYGAEVVCPAEMVCIEYVIVNG